jgi:RNA polymerase sigma-70 factor (ECF subfamily)
MTGEESNRSEDFGLVRAARGGDENAFGKLVLKYQGRIYSLAYGMLGNHSDADDLAQEIFLKCYRNIAKFRFKSSFYTWLYRIGVNTILTRRKQLRRKTHLELKPEILDIQGSPYLSPRLGGRRGDRAASSKELIRDIRAAIDRLPEKQRIVVIMHDIEGMPHAEISRILKTSPGTIRSRLHYGRLKLQADLAQWLEDK